MDRVHLVYPSLPGYPSILYDARYGYGTPGIPWSTRVPKYIIRRTLRLGCTRYTLAYPSSQVYYTTQATAVLRVHLVYPGLPEYPSILYDASYGSLKGAPGKPCHTRVPKHIIYDARYGSLKGAPDIPCHTRVPEYIIRRTLRQSKGCTWYTLPYPGIQVYIVRRTLRLGCTW